MLVLMNVVIARTALLLCIREFSVYILVQDTGYEPLDPSNRIPE
jgi:hypothetical protein